MTLTIGSLCTGYGGLDLAVEEVFADTRLAWVSEVDANACKVIDARFPGVPNVGDLTAADWSQVEPVDVLTAGYPCQPFSHAGKRKGTDDVRHLWPHIADAIGVLRPRLVVLENVAGHLSLGGPAAVAGLACLGYDCRWVVVRAADVGACHRRARWFCVGADTNRAGRSIIERVEPGMEPRRDVDGRSPSTSLTLLPTPVANDDHKTAAAHLAKKVASGAGEAITSLDVMARQAAATGEWSNRLLPTPAAWDGDRGPDYARANRDGSGGDDLVTIVAKAGVDFGAYADAIARHEHAMGRPAPAPTDDKGRLNPAFVEWMMMLPQGWVTDALTTRTAALKTLGNGVVPAQAAHALRLLLEVPA